MLRGWYKNIQATIRLRDMLKYLCVGVILYACKAKQLEESSSKNSQESTMVSLEDKKNIATSLAFYEKVLIPPAFSSLKMSGKIDVQTPTAYLPTLNATFYIEQNQKIWLNLDMFLLTVARAQATPSGIEAYVKTDKTYIQSDFEYLRTLLNLNSLDYKMLEKLLLGRTFVKVNSREFQMKEVENGYALISTLPQKYSEETAYDVRLEYTPEYHLSKVELKDIKTSDVLLVEYKNWVRFEDFFLPKNVKIIIKGSKKGEILIENTKFESQKMNAPFAIPKNYSKIDIK